MRKPRALGHWRNVGPFVRLTLDELEALPIGRVRSFELAGVLMAAYRTENGWRTHPRRIDSRLLADALSVERVPRPEARP